MRFHSKHLGARLGSKFLIRELAVGLFVLAVYAAPVSGQVTYDATVRRTEGGVPHIVANNYASLGYGTGYAMAQDNICLLADEFLTFAAERSRFLGPGTNNANLNSDFFYKLYIDRGEALELVDERQAEVFRGAAAGYNRYLRDTGVNNLPDPSCRGAAWVREISDIDFRRISRMNFFYPFLLTQIVSAAPPAAGASASDQALAADQPRQLASVMHALELLRDKGSNGLGLGRDATVDGTGMLLINPHLNWSGTNRFYAFHQTIPGEIDVAGANVMGRPQVGFGATGNIAFTNTVTTSPLNTFYRLNLVSGKPTKYLFDGAERDMLTETVTVQVADGSGGLQSQSHTFYSTHFAALLLGGFPWTTSNAYAVRATDAGWRSIESLVSQYQAKTVRELKAVHDQWQFWTGNLIAADSSGETLYADPIPCPNLTSAQVAACALPGALAGAIDGSRSDCMWKNDPDAVIPGILGPSKLPYVYRTDYVDNSNDSPWLSNPNEPLTYDAPYLGSIGTQRTLRTRSALFMVEKRLDGTDGQGAPNKFTLEQLQGLMMRDEAYTGQILRDGLVTLCQNNPVVTVSNPTEEVNISEACPVLAAWDLHDNLDSKGAHLFREFMRAAGSSGLLPTNFNYDVPFDVNDPVHTPRGLNAVNNPNALVALASAVRTLRNAGIALDADLGDIQYVTRNGERIPIHGGTNASGLFNIIGAPFSAAAGGYPDVTSGSSWIQATEFTSSGPVIRGILTYSESTNPNSPHYADQTKLFSQKKWITIPFNQQDVAAAATETVHLEETVAFTPTPTATRTATPTVTKTPTPMPTSSEEDDGGCTVSAPAEGGRMGAAWWLLIPVALVVQRRFRRRRRREEYGAACFDR